MKRIVRNGMKSGSEQPIPIYGAAEVAHDALALLPNEAHTLIPWRAYTLAGLLQRVLATRAIDLTIVTGKT
jgi:hypothetical protein